MDIIILLVHVASVILYIHTTVFESWPIEPSLFAGIWIYEVEELVYRTDTTHTDRKQILNVSWQLFVFILTSTIRTNTNKTTVFVALVSTKANTKWLFCPARVCVCVWIHAYIKLKQVTKSSEVSKELGKIARISQSLQTFVCKTFAKRNVSKIPTKSRQIEKLAKCWQKRPVFVQTAMEKLHGRPFNQLFNHAVKFEALTDTIAIHHKTWS